MTDWNNPTNSSTYVNYTTEVCDRDLSLLKMLDGTTDTNLPSGAKRYNSTAGHFEVWNGATWSAFAFHATLENHIANTAVHTPPPTGMVGMWPTGSAPSGWLLCQGQAVSRTTYAALFAVIGTTYGVGDNSTTFNLPDYQGKLPVGTSASITAINALAKTAGSWDHAHSVAAHTHNTIAHAHGMASHIHTQPTHQHGLDDHGHYVPAHYHDAQGAGADIAIASGGSHSHTTPSKQGVSNLGSSSRAGEATATGGSNTNITNSTDANHTHAHSSVTGKVGNVSSTRNGDADSQWTTNGVFGGPGLTQPSGNDATGGPSAANTDSTTDTATSSAGAQTSGTNNPPVLVINFIIKT